MTALIVIAVILCLIVLLLMTGVKVNIVSKGDIKVRVGAGPFMIKVFPTKKKKIKLRDFSQKKYLKLMDAEKAGEAVPTPAAKEKKEKGSLSHTISLVRKILERFDTYTGRIYTKISRLRVVVGGEDAASTAVTYGAVSGAAANLIELLSCKTRLRLPHPEKLSVVCDYTADSVTFDLDLTIKIRIIDAVKTAFEILMIKLKHDSELNTNNINNNKQTKGR